MLIARVVCISFGSRRIPMQYELINMNAVDR